MNVKKIITVAVAVCLLSILLVVPAFAVVTESSGDGYALYNGVKLPDINEVWTDKTTYPYAVICSSPVGTGQGYMLILLQSDGLVYRDGIFFSKTDNTLFMRGSQRMYAYADGVTNGWVDDGYSTNDFQPDQPIDIAWSSVVVWDYDIETEDVVYMPSSDPIPLDGMTVIEWDGDESGLESFSLSSLQYYRVADYFFTDSAIGVITDNDDHIVVWDNFDTIYDMGWMVTSSSSNVVALSLNNEAIGEISPSSTEGTYFTGNHIGNYHQWCSLVAYRSVESPPDEGGGDDDSQPPLGG